MSSNEAALLKIADKFAKAGDKYFARIFRELAEAVRLDEPPLRLIEYYGG